MGSVFYPLSSQISDTMAVHGYVWTWCHYCSAKRGAAALSDAEWAILSAQGVRALQGA